jgi:hypothetical protein
MHIPNDPTSLQVAANAERLVQPDPSSDMAAL